MSDYYTDLKLIDELLCDMHTLDMSWQDVEQSSSITRAAMARLRKAWFSGEMPVITHSLATYFEREKVSHLFCLGSYALHSGSVSPWKIECDALTDGDWRALAKMLNDVLPPFSTIEGVPRGGFKLADALWTYVHAAGPLLIVDDVLTSGESLEQHRAGRDAIGAVIFARQRCPTWITPLFQMTYKE